MSSETKFMFDYDFDFDKKSVEAANVEPEVEPEIVEEEPEIIVPTFSEEELQAAKDQAFAEGKQLGIQEGMASSEQALTNALQAIDAKLVSLVNSQNQMNEEIKLTAVKVATGIAKKMLPHIH